MRVIGQGVARCGELGSVGAGSMRWPGGRACACTQRRGAWEAAATSSFVGGLLLRGLLGRYGAGVGAVKLAHIIRSNFGVRKSRTKARAPDAVAPVPEKPSFKLQQKLGTLRNKSGPTKQFSVHDCFAEEGLGYRLVVPLPAYGFAALVSHNENLNSPKQNEPTSKRRGESE